MQSSIVDPSRGMKGTTSVAPMRGCSPVCLHRSIRSPATRMPAKAASTAVSTGATKVMTERLWDASEETSRTETPSTDAIAVRISSITSGRRPSEKLGTHSTSFIQPLSLAHVCAPHSLQQPCVHRRITGDERSGHRSSRITVQISDDSAGLLHHQHTGGNVPGCQDELPECVEPPTRDIREIERRRSSAADCGGY